MMPVFVIFITFFKLGLTSFGGPVAHLGYFRTQLISNKKWLSEQEYAQLLAICQFLPGPASSQVGFGIGLIKAGWLGGLAAFIGFTLPSVMLMLMFAFSLPYIPQELSRELIGGLKLVAFAVVADAVLGMAKGLCDDWFKRCLAIFSMAVIIIFSQTSLQLFVVIGAALIGIIYCKVRVKLSSKFEFKIAQPDQSHSLKVHYKEKVATVILAIFVVLFIVLGWLSGNENSSGLVYLANSFFQAGAMVFGGGHVVLPLLEQSIVESGLLSQQNFLAGYGAAQAIPGPMFSLSAYLGALIETGVHPVLSALVALFFMFLPGFLLLAAALPWWQKIATNSTAQISLSSINAAVVGLLAAALYNPIIVSGINSATDLIIGGVAFLLLLRLKLSALWIVAFCLTAKLALAMF